MARKRLGEFLLETKRISEKQLEEALAEQQQALSHRFLGEIFIERQILSLADFEAALQEYLADVGRNTAEDEARLGHLLLEAGAITQAQLDDCLEEQAARPDRPYLGQILVEEDYLSAEELETYLKNQKIILKYCRKQPD